MPPGERPYTGPWPEAVLANRRSEPVPHLRTGRDVPAALEGAVTKALARAPADRFPSAADFAAALQPYRSGASLAPSVAPRRRLPLAVVLAVMGAALGAVATLKWATPVR